MQHKPDFQKHIYPLFSKHCTENAFAALRFFLITYSSIHLDHDNHS